MGDPHPLHVAEGELAIGPCHWPARPDAGVASHHHDVQGGQREDVVDHPALGDVSEAQTRSALDLPPERRDDSEEGLYERRLAGTVGTDDAPPVALLDREVDVRQEDRKSTRLNSSQGYISYAVFCLKEKKKIIRSAVMNTPLSFRAPLVQDALPCFRNARLAPPIIVASAAVDSLASHTSPRRSVYPY